jgi:crotonobetainyl-CoA:carnitine CoA-transferase CaiB-like acyl-CoA transferase
MGFLEGLKVLDCTDERGLLAGRLLADLGADVVQVEPPSGSTARTATPVVAGGSAFWDVYAANKRGVTCDLDRPEGVAELKAMAARADIFVESSEPGVFDRLGLGWDVLRKLNGALIYVSITAFGSDGPKAGWAGTDLTVWAAGGPLAYNQDEVGPPLRISVPQTFLHAAADAAGGALLAYHARRRTRRGQRVEVSAQASLGLCTLAAALTAATGDKEPEWLPKRGIGPNIDQSGSGSRTRRSKWEVRDGFVELHLAMGPAAGAFTNNLFAWMRECGACPDGEIAGWDWRRLPDLIRQEAIDGDDMERARDLVARFLADKTKEEVTQAAIARKLLAVDVADVSDLTASPHFADRGFFVKVGDPAHATRTLPGAIARTDSDAFVFRRPAPLLGEHNEEVRRDWLGAGPAGPNAPSPDTARVPGLLPLDGLRVLDLSWVVAGPVIGRALADFGATVVRVESSTKIETARLVSPYYGGQAGVENAALYINCNAGKLGLALDLAMEQSRDVVRELATWADVLIESFTPGLMDRWGLGYQQLSAFNPRLIMVSSSLMGNTGRYSRLAGFGNIGAAMSGFQAIVGWPGWPPIGPFGPYTDYVAPRLALVTLLAALDERERSGRGCYLDVSQAECGVWFLSPQVAAFSADGTVPGACGNRDALFVPHGVFPCRRGGPGGAEHVAIAVRDDRDWHALAAIMSRAELAMDPRYATAEDRRAHEDQLEAIVAEWTASRTASEIEQVCQAAAVPAHRASTSTDFVTDPQLAHRGHLIRLPHRLHGEVVVEGPRYMLSDTPGRVVKAAPTIGEDNERVLVGMLGWDPERIEALERIGALR